MLHAIIDAIQVWAFLGGFLCVYDSIEYLIHKHNRVPFCTSKIRAVGTLLIGLAIISASALAVLSQVWPIIAPGTHYYWVSDLIVWILVGSAGWFATFKYTTKPKILYTVSVLALMATLLATFTVHA